jgi:D-galactose 1-dehydrogenase
VEVDAISICSPPRGRLALIEQALRSGLDVMIEKPPAATLSEAELSTTAASGLSRARAA